MIKINLKTMTPDEINRAFSENYMELKKAHKEVNPSTDQDVLMGLKPFKKASKKK